MNPEVQASCEECLDQTELELGWPTKVFDVGSVVCTNGKIEQLRSWTGGLEVLAATVLMGGHYPPFASAYLEQVAGVDLAGLPASIIGPFCADPAHSAYTFLQRDATLPCNIATVFVGRDAGGVLPPVGKIGPELRAIRCWT